MKDHQSIMLTNFLVPLFYFKDWMTRLATIATIFLSHIYYLKDSGVEIVNLFLNLLYITDKN